jgi:hypothetical protein
VTDAFNSRASTSLGRWLNCARGVLRDLAARHALRQELLECDRSGVLDSVLADLQMGRGELEPMIGNYPLSRRLFGAMAARLGVDPACDGPSMRRGLQHTCAVCAEQRRCQQWLDAGRTEGYEEFCPNADYWHALKERIRLAATRH